MDDAAGNLLVALLMLAIPGVLAFVGVRFLARANVAGAAFVVAAGLVPLAFAYAVGVGIIGAVAGGLAATIRSVGRVTPRRLVVLAAAVLLLASETRLIVIALDVRADESYDRCAADRAVVIIESSVARGRGYPADLHDISLADDGYGSGRCYVSNGVNWLYRVSAPGTYTLGYWVDCHVSRRVCLHRAASTGWECGFEMWGPFRPGETD